MKRILGYIKTYWYYYAISITAMLIGICLDMISPKLIQRIIDDVIKGHNEESFTKLIIALILISISIAVLGYVKELAFDYAGANVIVRLRKDLFNHIQNLSVNFFDTKNTGELMARIKEDADKIWHGISFGIIIMIEIATYFVIAIILMISISPKLALLSFIAVPIIGYLAMKLEKDIGKTYEDISEENAKLNTIAQENIAGVRLVKAFARENHEVKKFLESNENYYKLNVKQGIVFGKYFPKMQFLSNVLPTLVVTFGGAYVINEKLSIGTLIQFNMYMAMIIFPMRMIGWLTNVMAEALASAKKINIIFEEKTEIVNTENPIIFDKVYGNITFNNVSLILNDTKILEDINFEVKEGKTLGIMGATGSGKSSIINLLTRFYDTTEGSICLDGNDIKLLELQQLRKQISIVMQDVFLFSDTIEENIKLGNKHMIEEKHMLEASKKAQAYEFIDEMEDGFNTVIGERGIGLSGGQKQRISIARALAKKCPILIFDDSTSALDMETEYRIQKAINKMKNVTKIIIAHRISSVKQADEIIILEDGRIVERGTHKQLMELHGRYYDTFIEQYEDYKAV